MKYICLVYNEPATLDSLTEAELTEHVGAIGSWVKDLEKSGFHVYSAGLQSPSTGATLRIRGGELLVTDGPYAETKEVLGGFTIIEARDLNEAIQIFSKMDAARVGTVEVRPLLDPALDMPDPIDRKIAAAINRRGAI